jgi:hypothetical protein
LTISIKNGQYGKRGEAMSKKNATILFLLIMGVGNLFAETLIIRVENIDPGKGHLMTGIFNNERGFPDDCFLAEVV